MSEPRTWASVHKEWLGDGSLMNGYTKRGLSYATGEMAWNASRAALLADTPDVERIVAKINGYLNCDDEWPFDDAGEWIDLRATLLSQAARIKALEEENAKLKREDAFRHANCIVAQRLDGDLPCAALRAAREEIAKLKGHAEEMAAACEVQHRTRLNDAVAAYRRDYPEES